MKFAVNVLRVLVICSLLGAMILLYRHFGGQIQSLEHYIITLENRLEEYSVKHGSINSVSLVDTDIQGTAVSSQLWSKLQPKLQDTVVQLFVSQLDRDVLQPYKVPKQGMGSGSGFFISSDGEILTNAHVVNQATSIVVQIPSFGKRQFEVDLVGLMPERDFALVKLRKEDKELVEHSVGKLPVLELGDSDTVVRSQEILALGYPLGQQALKSTTGVVSGRESGMLQISAPINPGNSGGPSINYAGQAIGINTAGIMAAQNVGYIIPINDVKIFLDDLRKGGLVRKPYIGVFQLPVTTSELVKSLGNPMPGGPYIVEVLHDSPLHGRLKAGDMIYKVNGVDVDLYGEMSVGWSEDKVSTAEYISRLSVGQKVVMEVYRNGKKMEFVCTFDRKKLAPIRQMYPGYEELPYEVVGGLVIMPLMLNHLQHLAPSAPSLARFAEERNQADPVLVVTHIIPDSQAHKTRLRLIGSTIEKINGKEVKTLQDLQHAVERSDDMITFETSEHIPVAFATQKVIDQELALSKMFGYQTTPAIQRLLKKRTA